MLRKLISLSVIIYLVPHVSISYDHCFTCCDFQGRHLTSQPIDKEKQSKTNKRRNVSKEFLMQFNPKRKTIGLKEIYWKLSEKIVNKLDKLHFCSMKVCFLLGNCKFSKTGFWTHGSLTISLSPFKTQKMSRSSTFARNLPCFIYSPTHNRSVLFFVIYEMLMEGKVLL